MFRQHMKALTFCSHFKKRVVMKDLAFPDSGRLLQGPASSDSTSDDSGGLSNPVAISVAGVGLILLCTIWCITSSVRSGLATRVVTVTSAPVLPQDERAGDAIQSTLQRKHAILELFRTSQVTMVR